MVNIQYKKEPLKGYPGYQIDTLGNVYNKNGTIKKHSVNWNGYHVVNFSINGQQKGASIHSLVAKQFIPNEDPAKNQVNHKDGDKSNNKVENLYWCTQSENNLNPITNERMKIAQKGNEQIKKATECAAIKNRKKVS